MVKGYKHVHFIKGGIDFLTKMLADPMVGGCPPKYIFLEIIH